MKLLAVAGGVVGITVGAVLLVPLVVLTAGVTLLVGAPTVGASGQRPSATATERVTDIPAPMAVLYVRAAGRCPGLSWTVLAAIGKVESDHGRGGGRSSAGAEGPMQFLPSTWARYGVDGDGDGIASIWDAADAIPAAADYLCANGAATSSGLAGAIYRYNHDVTYVRTVLATAASYQQISG